MPRFSARIVPSVAMVLAAGLSSSVFAQEATYRVVARSGQFAPGGGFFSSFGSPVISSTGRVAFKASVVGVLANRGVWSEGVSGMNNLEPVVRRNDPIPGAMGNFIDSIIPSAGIVMNSSGEIAFSVAISGTQTQYGDYAILVHDANGVKSIAVPGQLVSLPCGGVVCQRWLADIGTSLFAFNAAGQVGFRTTIDGTGVNSDNDHLLIVSDGNTTQVALREGDIPPGTFGVEFGSTIYTRIHLNDEGEILARNFVRDLNSNHTYWSVWRGQPGAVSLVAAENMLAPVGGLFFGQFFNYGEMAFNNAGDAVFVQIVEDNQGDQRDGLWINSNAPTQTVCFEGMPAPSGMTYNRPTTYSPSVNANGVIAYIGVLDGAAHDEDTVLIRRLPNGNETLIVREGDQAPGLFNGVAFLHPGYGFSQILDDGRIAFRSQLAGPGVHAGNNDSVWISREGAPPAMLLRTGQSMTVGGQVKTVEHFVTTMSAGSESGTPSGVSELGQVAMQVVFTDGTQAIIVASPLGTCPGDVNGDGVVNFADLNAVLGAFGHLGDVIPGDLDLDGDVDFADLNQVLSNFGVDCPN